MHLKSEDGSWEVSDIDLRQDPDYWAGGHGLHSTPRDYLKFQRMLLGDGTSPDGVRDPPQGDRRRRLPQPDRRRSTSRRRSPPPTRPRRCDFNAGPGCKWGYGLLLNTEDVPGMRRACSGAWAGLLNTHFWVDRTTGVTGAIYTQFLPFVTPEAFGMYQDFERGAVRVAVGAGRGCGYAPPAAARSRRTAAGRGTP